MDESTEVSPREREVVRVISRLKIAVGDLEETAKQFNARLEGVIGGELNKEAEEVILPEFGSKLGQELNNIHGRIYKAGKSLHDLLQRVEL